MGGVSEWLSELMCVAECDCVRMCLLVSGARLVEWQRLWCACGSCLRRLHVHEGSGPARRSRQVSSRRALKFIKRWVLMLCGSFFSFRLGL